VLTVKKPEREFVSPDAQRVQPANILVATDFGPAAANALTYGRALARTFNARLHVLHVTPDAEMYAGPESVGVDVVALQARIDADAVRALDGIVRDDDRRELNATAEIRHATTPARAIVNYATDSGIDLIIVGTHGRKAMAYLFMGSVAERVVRTAPCPVLAVRYPEHEFVLPDAMQVVAHGVLQR
jgi:nucleotide-binding universal stress UspA family protein